MGFTLNRLYHHLTGGNRSFYPLDITHALITTHTAKIALLFYSILGLKIFDSLSQQPWDQTISVFTNLDDQPRKKSPTVEKSGKGSPPNQLNGPFLDPYAFEGNLASLSDKNVLQSSKHSADIKNQISSLKNELNESRYMLVLPFLKLKYLEWKHPEFSENQKILKNRLLWEQEDIGNRVYLEKRKKER